ncbi:hypothetical protein NC652_007749 [Populus alba x Populus x berolinensis]|nr:hypothetical protein NC652_007749 [Populus alba x Populus x berolinensis]
MIVVEAEFFHKLREKKNVGPMCSHLRDDIHYYYKELWRKVSDSDDEHQCSCLLDMGIKALRFGLLEIELRGGNGEYQYAKCA